jgi:hypothetical protein
MKNEVIILGTGKLGKYILDAPVLTRDSLSEIPVDMVADTLGFDYFGPPESYLIAFAIYMGYEKIRIYGVNFDNRENFDDDKSHIAFWLGYANGRGIEYEIGENTKLYRVIKDNVKDRYNKARNRLSDQDEMEKLASEGKDPYVFVSGIDPSAITFITRDKRGKELSRWWS